MAHYVKVRQMLKQIKTQRTTQDLLLYCDDPFEAKRC